MGKVNKRQFGKIMLLVLAVLIVVVVICLILFRKELTIQNWSYKSDVEGIEMELIKSVFSEDETYLAVTWRNHTNENVAYGQEFSLYEEVNGEWKACDFDTSDNVAWIWESILYNVSPGGSQRRDYWVGMFQPLKEGNYKLKQEYYLGKNKRDAQSMEFYFQVGYEYSIKEPAILNWLKPDYKKVSFEIWSASFSEDNSWIYAEWQNHSNKNINYVHGFQLYKETDGNWEECSVVDESYFFNDIVTIRPNSETNAAGRRSFFNLDAFGSLEEGKYRLVEEYYFGDDDTKTYNVEIDFQVVYE